MSINPNNAAAEFNSRGSDDNEPSAKVLSFPFKHPANSEFLQAVFGDDAGHAWVADVHDGNKADWFGRRADTCDVDAPEFTSGDTYFAVGVLKKDASARGIAHWSHTPIIVVDDVGEKCSAEAVRAALGEPSYVLSTSAKSRQFGYFLTKPLREADTQTRIMRALTIAFYRGIDPGHRDTVRYVRLPRGVNSKPKRVAENDGKPQTVTMLEWHPERRLDVLDLMMALDDLPGLAGGTAWSEAEGAGVTHCAMPENLPRTLEEARAFYLPRDYIFAALDRLDRVVGMQGSQGYIEVRCPFNGHPDYGVHTNDDDRTGWNPELFLNGRTAFQCFHSDGGADRSNRGIEAALRAELDARDGPGAFDALKHAAIAATFPPLPDTDSDADRQPAEKRTRRLVPLGRNAPTTPLLARRSICSFMARGEVATVAGQPGTGKSAFVLGAALAIAADRPDLIGEKAFERTGDVLIVSKEDNLDAVRRRRAGWLKTHGIDANSLRHEPHFVDDPDFTAAAFDGSRVELSADMAWLGEQIAVLRAQDRDVCAVVLDTLPAVLEGVVENDNSSMARVMALLSSWAACMTWQLSSLCICRKRTGATVARASLRPSVARAPSGAECASQ
ncbi:AAA family ATPase [Reyranella sp.]|uniref:AAA family ATPase n=1 Tax=Reyranella sp. TaxID=1929291 RepID=UPI003784318E